MHMSNGNCDLAGVVAIGASAGGVEALMRLTEGLSADLPYAFLVAVHLSPAAPSVLASIVGRRGRLPAVAAEHGTEVEPAHIYVAIPDHHLLVADHRVVLSREPTKNGHRPAINALFRSAALAFGPRAVGVLLSGVLDDGVQGLGTIRARGGVTIGQTPADALFPAMPTNAAAAGVLDYQVSAAGVGPLLEELAQREITYCGSEPDKTPELGNQIAMAPRFATEHLDPASGHACSDWDGSALGHDNFRCRVGHARSLESLLDGSDDEFENALLVALRSLREKAGLARKLADRTGQGLMAERYRHNADEAERSLAVLSERLGLSGRPGGAGD